jgi:hypothetical protein
MKVKITLKNNVGNSFNRVAAIKEYRNLTGCSLKEAADLFRVNQEKNDSFVAEIPNFADYDKVYSMFWVDVINEEVVAPKTSLMTIKNLLQACINKEEYDLAIDLINLLKKWG